MGKGLLFRSMAILFLAGACALASCHDDDDLNIKRTTTSQINPNLDGVEYAITDSVLLTAAEVADMIYGPDDGSNMDEDTQAARKLFLENAQKDADAFAAEMGANGVVTYYHSVNYTYKTTDQHGKEIELSAKAVWGSFGFSVFGLNFYQDLDPNNVFLVEHCSFTENSHIPTNSMGMNGNFLHDNLAIMPDYIGYGKTLDKLHPFMNNEVNGKNSYDALLAGLKVYQENKDLRSDLESGAKLYILGSGEGAAYGLAAQKYLESQPEYDDSWNFGYSYLCQGNYSAPLSVDRWLDIKKMETIYYFPMLVKSMFDSYPELLKKWKEDDFYSESYLKVKSQIDKLLADKNMETNTLTTNMCNAIGLTGGNVVAIDKMLSNAALDKNSELMKDFYKCLEKNDLTQGWTPKNKIKFYHQKDYDYTSPKTQIEAMQKSFDDKVEVDWADTWGEDGTFWYIINKWNWKISLGNW